MSISEHMKAEMWKLFLPTCYTMELYKKIQTEKIEKHVNKGTNVVSHSNIGKEIGSLPLIYPHS